MARRAKDDTWLASRLSHQAARDILLAKGLCLWRCGRKAAKGKRLCAFCNALNNQRTHDRRVH